MQAVEMLTNGERSEATPRIHNPVQPHESDDLPIVTPTRHVAGKLKELATGLFTLEGTDIESVLREQGDFPILVYHQKEKFQPAPVDGVDHWPIFVSWYSSWHQGYERLHRHDCMEMYFQEAGASRLTILVDGKLVSRVLTPHTWAVVLPRRWHFLEHLQHPSWGHVIKPNSIPHGTKEYKEVWEG